MLINQQLLIHCRVFQIILSSFVFGDLAQHSLPVKGWAFNSVLERLLTQLWHISLCRSPSCLYNGYTDHQVTSKNQLGEDYHLSSGLRLQQTLHCQGYATPSKAPRILVARRRLTSTHPDGQRTLRSGSIKLKEGRRLKNEPGLLTNLGQQDFLKSI